MKGNTDMSNKCKLLYEDGTTVLYQGDCRDLEIKPGSIDAIITGPPYVAGRAEELDLLGIIAPKLIDCLVPGGLFVSTNTDLRKGGAIRLRHLDILSAFSNAGLTLYDYRIWDKEMGHHLYRIAFSHILAFYKGEKPKIRRPLTTDDILIGKAKTFGKYHDANSHQVFRKLIEIYSREGDTIYDPFVGSGTLLIEARRLGRKSIGIELDVEIAELCRKRLVSTVGNVGETSAETGAKQLGF